MSATNSSLPLGVAIIAILIGILGFFTLLFGILVLAGVTVSAFFGVPVFLGVGGLTLALIVIILGIVLLAVAYGLWDLNMWALALAVLVLIVEMAIYGLAGAFVSFGFIASLILFVYLLAVSSHFS